MMKQTTIATILLLSHLLVPPSAEAFFGFGKYPSKMEAKEACEEWRLKGRMETYTALVPLSKREIAELPITKEYNEEIERLREKGASTRPLTVSYKLRLLSQSSKPVLKESLVRKCVLEADTRQIIGIDKQHKKHFRY